MALSDTKSYVIDAAGTTVTDFMTAIIAHFTSAPGRWQLKTGVAPTAGAALVITEKTNRKSDIAIRRSGSHLRARVAPDLDITAAGDASTPSTAGANASPEARTRDFSGISTRFYICEHDDAVTILFLNTAKTAMPEGIHAGVVYDAQFAEDAADGLTGHGVLVGQTALDTSSVNSFPWFTSSTSNIADSSRIRGWDSAGVAVWGQPSRLGTYSSSGSGANISSASDDGLIKSPRAMPLVCSDAGGSSDLIVGQTRYLRAAPYIATTLMGQLPRVRLESATNEGWLYIYATATAAANIIPWERSVSPT